MFFGVDVLKTYYQAYIHGVKEYKIISCGYGA